MIQSVQFDLPAQFARCLRRCLKGIHHAGIPDQRRSVSTVNADIGADVQVGITGFQIRFHKLHFTEIGKPVEIDNGTARMAVSKADEFQAMIVSHCLGRFEMLF